MHELNLPAFACTLKTEGGKVWIFDGIRKKFVVLTPEEWVRQHLVNYLVTELNYPRSMIKIESGLKYNKLSKRSDAVVFDRQGKCWMVIECKSPEHKIDPETARQVATYNMSLKARYILVSNGLQHFCHEVDFAEARVKPLADLPVYG